MTSQDTNEVYVCRGIMLSINSYIKIQTAWGKVGQGGKREITELAIVAVSKAFIIFFNCMSSANRI